MFDEVVKKSRVTIPLIILVLAAVVVASVVAMHFVNEHRQAILRAELAANAERQYIQKIAEAIDKVTQELQVADVDLKILEKRASTSVRKGGKPIPRELWPIEVSEEYQEAERHCEQLNKKLADLRTEFEKRSKK